jgi:biopolymer transport protein ExbD
MGMTAVAGRRGIQSEINVTPMVDIMLVLPSSHP